MKKLGKEGKRSVTSSKPRKKKKQKKDNSFFGSLFG